MGQRESTLNDAANDVDNSDDDSYVQVIINNVVYKVSKNIPVRTTLNTFIRNVAKLKGTKAMCLEGGCGSCIVAAEINGSTISVNSCLVPIFICNGWNITTIEGLGDRKSGYHTLQATLADMNGSQCGFCSPGWVMNMYSITNGKKLTMKEIENSFAGNLCRCTGYRPILEAFKSFASDAPPMMQKQIKDIEDLYNVKSCKNCPKEMCTGTCKDLEIIYKSSVPKSIEIAFGKSGKFFKVLEVNDIFSIFYNNPNSTYIMHGGNTAHGVYRTEPKQLYIDINDVPDLHRIEKEKDYLILGANVTLTVLRETCLKYMNDPGFEYLKVMAEHIDLVAHIPVKNIGTIAGNLMIKYQHREFPSDIFLILETAGAQIHILDAPGSKTTMSFYEFLNLNMDRKLIYSIVLPYMSKDYCYKTFKIMPRAQNAHAVVNAGFLFKLDNNGKVLEKPNIIFGGIRPDFIHATETEHFLEGKSIYDETSLQQALKTLNAEVKPDYVLPDFKPEYRKLLATCLLYKFVISSNPKKADPKFRSGGTALKRELSSGKQDYNIDRDSWPVNEPIPKIEAIYQTSGEGEYVNDLIIRPDEVFCALTLAPVPGTIMRIDSAEALEMEGVIAFFTANDIPGKNTFLNKSQQYFQVFEDEILFAKKTISYSGQAYGIIAAKTQDLAQHAASKVKLIYTKGPKRKPMITVHDVIASNDKTRIKKVINNGSKALTGLDAKHKIEGTCESGSQYHFSMETQTCVCVPIEDGMDVFSSTQWMDVTQNGIATMLDVPANSINVKVRRLGGAYGAKIFRATHIACACALVCHKLNRPARLVLTIEDNMRMIGKRVSAYLQYNLSVDEKGKIQELKATSWSNLGISFNESASPKVAPAFYNCYDSSSWTLDGYDVKTDIASNAWCRSPGSTEGMAMIEQIMEKIARVVDKDPVDVRLANMPEKEKTVLSPLIDQLKKTSDYVNRVKEIDKFNKDNRWKKRGISLVPMKYHLNTVAPFHSLVSIYARDGTVSVSCGGIEMGQGLYTKVAQIAAYALGIDLNMVSVKPSICWTAPNDFFTGGGFGSDTCGYATQMACKELLTRLEPIKLKLGGNPSWKELVLKAHTDHVDLCATFMFTPAKAIKEYAVYGATVSEVEVDILTGQHIIHRVDILEDVGRSLSPKIDVGQIEGAFIMGLGLWTSEDLLYDPETGGLTNYRTWNYKIPGAKDIPVDFRISFLRNAPSPYGILRSKTTGEAPLCMSVSVPFAIRQALNAARADADNSDPWYNLDNAVTVEKILMSSLTNLEDMKL